MTVTQRGKLTPEDEQRLREARERIQTWEMVLAEYRAIAVEMVEKSSYREVERLTGISTNTLQRWKREVGK